MASVIGTEWEDKCQNYLGTQCGPSVIRNKSNADEPDLVQGSAGYECKWRSGEYEMTYSHIRDGIVPKYYLGVWIPVGRSRTGATRYKYQPWTNANGDFIPKKQYSERYVIMNDIPTIEERAQGLWAKIDVKIITLQSLTTKQRPENRLEQPQDELMSNQHSFCMNDTNVIIGSEYGIGNDYVEIGMPVGLLSGNIERDMELLRHPYGVSQLPPYAASFPGRG